MGELNSKKRQSLIKHMTEKINNLLSEAHEYGLREPLPVNDFTDFQALSCYNRLSIRWLAYQSDEASDKLRAKAAKSIDKVYKALHRKKPGRRPKAVELEPVIEKLVRKRAGEVFSIYREFEENAINTDWRIKLEKELLSHLINYIGEVEEESMLWYDAGWKKKLEDVNWRHRQLTKGIASAFVNDVIVALTGHTVGSLRKAKERKKKKQPT